MTEEKSSTGNLFGLIAGIYFGIGGIVASISLGSTAIFYTFGPGAIWNIGFIAWWVGGFLGVVGSFFRLVTWPYGIYVLVQDPAGFFPWLFYLWYQ